MVHVESSIQIYPVCKIKKNPLSDMLKLIFDQHRLKMMDIYFTKDVSQKMEENQQLRDV